MFIFTRQRAKSLTRKWDRVLSRSFRLNNQADEALKRIRVSMDRLTFEESVITRTKAQTTRIIDAFANPQSK